MRPFLNAFRYGGKTIPFLAAAKVRVRVLIIQGFLEKIFSGVSVRAVSSPHIRHFSHQHPVRRRQLVVQDAAARGIFQVYGFFMITRGAGAVDSQSFAALCVQDAELCIAAHRAPNPYLKEGKFRRCTYDIYRKQVALKKAVA